MANVGKLSDKGLIREFVNVGPMDFKEHDDYETWLDEITLEITDRHLDKEAGEAMRLSAIT